MKRQPLLVNLLARLPVDGLPLSTPLRRRDPHMSRPAVAIPVDRPLPVVPSSHGSSSDSATRSATYSSTHSGRIRRSRPSFTDRKSPEMIAIRTFDSPHASISATSATVYQRLANL